MAQGVRLLVQVDFLGHVEAAVVVAIVLAGREQAFRALLRAGVAARLVALLRVLLLILLILRGCRHIVLLVRYRVGSIMAQAARPSAHATGGGAAGSFQGAP